MFKKKLIDFAIQRPKMVLWGVGLITILFLIAFPNLTTDTDPVKMLPQDNPAITLYNKVKADFEVYDLVALGIESKDGSSLFTPDRLERIHKITQEILKIQSPESKSQFAKIISAVQFMKNGKEDNDREIMVLEDVMSLSTVDDIVLNSGGELELIRMMKEPPKTEEEAKDLLRRINNNPILHGKLASEDGSLTGIFIPLKNGKKDKSYYLGEEMKKIADKHLGPNERYYLAGLPIAENTFGNEMFIQMAVYAPAAGLVIFLLLFMFFRNINMVLAPMLLSFVTVIWAMGALIYSGNTIHIMSSMIPIFLMPIGVLDSTHIISSLYDQIHKFSSREEAIRDVMNELFNPMLFTSITTTVGFSSLASTGIPPVVVFGITVGFGVMVAWILSMLMIPAYFMLLSDKALENFGNGKKEGKSKFRPMEVVQYFKRLANKIPGSIMIMAVVALVISVVGLTKIVINDNPVRWFKADHVLRKADLTMNKKLAGTYQAHLVVSIPEMEAMTQKAAKEEESAEDEFAEDEFSEESETELQLPSIRDPKVIRYMADLAEYMKTIRDRDGKIIVGGVTSIVDILQKVGDVALNDSSLPETREKVSQYMFLFESGDRKKGRDMWKFIKPGESTSAQMWIQMKTGDNQNMALLMNKVSEYMEKNPLPVLEGPGDDLFAVEMKWSGLTHINNIWQEEMVSGMRDALGGSFVIVFIMMVVLFRSIKWGFIAMFPLSLTILIIYGAIGFTGKYYDMPIAVLSSLTLGLSIDFAIHFIESARFTYKEQKNITDTMRVMFEGTAQAIWRNVLVIAIGFLPLFFATLVPYVTVGSFFFAIMLVSGVATLILLPAIVNKFHRWLPGING